MMTDIKFSVDYLSKVQLTYELTFRGFGQCTSIDEGRKALRNLLKSEKSNSSKLKYPEYCYKYADDVAALTTLIAEIETLIVDFDGNDGLGEYRKICTNLWHGIGRVTLTGCNPQLAQHCSRLGVLYTR